MGLPGYMLFGKLVLIQRTALTQLHFCERMKEFGIRKVLGASVTQISMLHINYFIRLVLIACAVAMSVAFILIGEWRSTFAYRVELNYLPFLLVVWLPLG